MKCSEQNGTCIMMCSRDENTNTREEAVECGEEEKRAALVTLKIFCCATATASTLFVNLSGCNVQKTESNSSPQLPQQY